MTLIYRPPIFPPPDSEASAFSDPEIEFKPQHEYTTRSISKTFYPPPPSHLHYQSNPLGSTRPRKVATPQVIEARKFKDATMKRARRSIWIKRILVILAFSVGVLSWAGLGGNGFEDELCKIGMGPCLRLEEKIEEKVYSSAENLKKFENEVESKVQRNRGIQLVGDEDFGTILQVIAGTSKQANEVVRGLTKGRLDMYGHLVQLSDHDDNLKPLREEMMLGFASANQTAIQHRESISLVVHHSRTYITRAIDRLEKLRTKGLGIFTRSMYRFFGDEKGEQKMLQKKIDREVKDLVGYLETVIALYFRNLDQELEDFMALRDTWMKVALIFTKGSPDENSFEDADYWSVLMREQTTLGVNFGRVSSEWVGNWVTIEGARFLVADNVERVKALKISLLSLRDGPCAAYYENPEAIADYINKLQEIRRKLEAKATAK